MPLSGVLLLASGCTAGGSSKLGQAQALDSKAQGQQSRQAARTREDVARGELEQILPPSKNLYLNVRSQSAYGNPFLIVQRETVMVTIIFPDRNPKGFGTGGMLRPVGARRQQLEVRLADLPTALASLPPEVWPYGRVVAVAESPSAAGVQRVAIRRNVEATIRILNDLGIVVDEWNGGNGTLLH